MMIIIITVIAHYRSLTSPGGLTSVIKIYGLAVLPDKVLGLLQTMRQKGVPSNRVQVRQEQRLDSEADR
jgi:hypothetical protein